MGGQPGPVKGGCKSFLHFLAVQGWGKEQSETDPILRPAWVEDDGAFWVSAVGQSMRPEGIRPKDLVLISPNKEPRAGDRVFIREASSDRRVSIKRLTAIDDKIATLRGWMPPRAGQQQSFEEQRPLSAIADLFPVIAVYRGMPGDEESNVQFLPDPRQSQAMEVDDVVMLELQGADGVASKSAPSVLGVPKDLLKRRGVEPRSAAMYFVSDDHLLPGLPAGTSVICDTTSLGIQARQLYVLRHNGKALTRRVEQLPDGTLLLTGDAPGAASTQIPAARRGSVEIVGRVLWSFKTA